MDNFSAKKAFTMLELIFVIVVVGILAAEMAPRFTRDNLQEAADQVISHIRYTQHLAMMDDKFDNNDQNWFKERWQLRFARSVDSVMVWSYTIFSDRNYDANPNISDDIAKNPTNSNIYLSGGYSGILNLTDSRRDKDMALGEKYGVKKVIFSTSCSNSSEDNQSRKIIFDSSGRPYWGYSTNDLRTNPYKDMYLIEKKCKIALCGNDICDNNITIAIEPETGYAHIL